ncbi:MAG TPA: phosphodiester glycosidase family protein, partial [Rhodothermales bacterium]|nr:phosphodiester glycosidase family protein [Rhodothermales bacterium]
PARMGLPDPVLPPGRPWQPREAMGAGPMLVRGGNVRVTAAEELFFGSSIPATHPRTAAGVTLDGALVFVVVDGRQMASRGVNLNELARLMLEAGARDALNLDGGGSSTLVVRGVRLNRPLGGTVEREVMNAFVASCMARRSDTN